MMKFDTVLSIRFFISALPQNDNTLLRIAQNVTARTNLKKTYVAKNQRKNAPLPNFLKEFSRYFQKPFYFEIKNLAKL